MLFALAFDIHTCDCKANYKSVVFCGRFQQLARICLERALEDFAEPKGSEDDSRVFLMGMFRES